MAFQYNDTKTISLLVNWTVVVGKKQKEKVGEKIWMKI